MASLLSTTTLRPLLHEIPVDEAEAAWNQLAEENPDKIDTVQALAQEVNRLGGDFNRIVAVTHKPVSIDDFIDDPYFLNMKDSIYPEVRKVVKDVIEGGYIQFLAMGAIGRGKTTAAQIITAYHLYLLSREKFPQARYGLMSTSSIVFAMLNKTEQLAKDVTFGEFHTLLSPVGYFQEQFPFDPTVKSRMEFPNNIRVEYAAAYASKLLGKNIIGGVVDEMNFMSRVEKSKQSATGGEFNQARAIHTAIFRRRKSRFLHKGKLPGCICVVSSAGYPGDFTDLLKAEVETDNDGLTKVWDGPQWEVVPASRFSGKRFLLELGDERHGSRIISTREEARPKAVILEPPIEYKKDFEDDMEGSIRDIAGRNIAIDRPYFWDRAKVWAMGDRNRAAGFVNPFKVMTWDLSRGMPEVDEENWTSIPYPQRARAMHIDLAMNKDARGDACGVAMGYVYKVEGQRQRVRGSLDMIVVEEVPWVRYDFSLQITAPRNAEIEFAQVREFVYWVRNELGYPLKYVTFDGFQSVDSRQILRKAGFATDVVSVEGIEAYEAFRTAVWQGRVDAPENSIAFNELIKLKEDRKEQKIDHPPAGSKDVADGMAGVYKTLVGRRESWTPAAPQGPVPVYNERGRIVGARPMSSTIRRNIVRRNVVRS